MRYYVSGKWGFGLIWGLTASVFPRSLAIAFPNAMIPLVLGYFGDWRGDEEVDVADHSFKILAGFSSVLFFVLYFRSNVAYSRWWEGGTLLQQTRGEWFNAYSSLIAFSATDVKMADKVEEFHHLLARLMSMLFCAALQQVSPIKDIPFEILDNTGIDPESLEFLEESSDKVEVLLQWIQRSTIVNMQSGVLPIPPPVMSRAFQEISRGIVNLQNARKIADFPFPFPYAQTSIVMLLIHWITCPLLASMLLDSYLASALSFIVVFFLWCINFIALQLEFPFGNGENDLPMQQFQTDWNKSVGTLLAKRAQQPPSFSFDAPSHRKLDIVKSDGSSKAPRRLTVPPQYHHSSGQGGATRSQSKDSSESGSPSRRPSLKSERSKRTSTHSTLSSAIEAPASQGKTSLECIPNGDAGPTSAAPATDANKASASSRPLEAAQEKCSTSPVVPTASPSSVPTQLSLPDVEKIKGSLSSLGQVLDNLTQPIDNAMGQVHEETATIDHVTNSAGARDPVAGAATEHSSVPPSDIEDVPRLLAGGRQIEIMEGEGTTANVAVRSGCMGAAAEPGASHCGSNALQFCMI